MKISIAQLKPFRGDINRNLEKHKRMVDMAVAKGADLVVFPELSLTGYEPKLSKELATHPGDERLDEFQKRSDAKHIVIGVGMPVNNVAGILIGMVIFQPDQPRQTYFKQHLHSDELPYFVNGQQQVILTIKNTKIAPAICYESLLPEHAENAVQSGADIYLASVAKSANGIAKAYKHYPAMAKKYSIPVLMSNCTGACEDFESAGSSAIWDKNGMIQKQFDETSEGILVFDTDTNEVTEWREQENSFWQGSV